MRVEKIDHIHVYVKDLDKAVAFFSDVLGTKFAGPLELGAPVNLRSYLDPLGIELITSSTPDGVVAKTIEKRGEGLTAISFKVPNLDEAVAELQAQGLRLVGTVHLGNLREAQFHPRDSYGVMIEPCEYQEKQAALVAAQESKLAYGTVKK